MKKIKRLMAVVALVMAVIMMNLASPAASVISLFRGDSFNTADRTTSLAVADEKSGHILTIGRVPSEGKVAQDITLPFGYTQAATFGAEWLVDPNPQGATQAEKDGVPNPNYGKMTGILGSDPDEDVVCTVYKSGGTIDTKFVYEEVYDNDLMDYVAKPWVFTPGSAGRYTVVYSYKNNNGFSGFEEFETISEKFIIDVVGQEITIELAKNNSKIIPITAATSGTVKPVVLPYPVVKDENGDYIFDPATGNRNPDAKYNEYELLVEVINTKYYASNIDEFSQTETRLNLPKDGGFYKFTPETGTNVVRYTVLQDGFTIASVSKTVIGSSTYDVSKIDIGYRVNGAPTTASLKEEVTLPYASAFNKNDANNTVEVYTSVKVEWRGPSTPGNPSGLVEYTKGSGFFGEYETGDEKEGFWFIPQERGDYRITYTVVDFYDKGGASSAWSYTIEDVKITVAPKLYIVDGGSADYGYYDNVLGQVGDVNMADAKWMVPSSVGMNRIDPSTGQTTITFPAFYAEDNAVAFENLTFSREITSTVLDSSILLQSATYHKIDADTTVTEGYKRAARNVTITMSNIDDTADITKPGTYVITYRVSNGSGYSSSWSFTFEVLDSMTDDTDPVITYRDNFPTLVDNKQTVSFQKPIIADRCTNMKIRYFVEIGGQNVLEIKEDENDSTKLTFKMSDLSDKDAFTQGQYENKTLYDLSWMIPGANGTIKVVTTAEDDYWREGRGEKTITVSNKNDAYAPQVTARGVVDYTNTYNQFRVVQVNGITVIDNDKSLETYITVRDANGRIVTGYTTLGNTVRTNIGNNPNYGSETVYQYVFPGVSFTGNRAESYTVTYTAIDSGNNFISYTYQIKPLQDREPPVISGVVNGKIFTMQLGTRLDLGDASAIDNFDSGIEVNIICKENSNYLIGNIFAPQATGDYTISYSAEDNEGNKAISVNVTVKVVNTTAPILTLKNNHPLAKIDSLQIFDPEVTDATKYQKILLPAFETYKECDLAVEPDALKSTGSIKIEGPNKTYTLDAGDPALRITECHDEVNKYDWYEFQPSYRGTYTVTYTAVDRNGNNATPIVITIRVGDNILPQLKFLKTYKSTMKIGDKLVFDKLNDIQIKDNVDKEADLEVYTISLTNDQNGSSVDYVTSGDEDEIRTYTFKSAGVYTLTVTSKDAAGNIGSVSHQVTITTEGTSSGISNEVLGTILIVVSLLILAGVIIYFARGKKSVAKAEVVSSAKSEKTSEKTIKKGK